MWLFGGTQQGISYDGVDHVQGQRYWGLILESGKHGAGVMPDVSAGMDRGAMPRVAVADTSECVAERGQLMVE